ncbi:MAG: hypothetical protein ACR2RE_06785 [Geminicoccaceae bacterium]
MSLGEAWTKTFALRVVLILITAAMTIVTSLMVASVVGLWNLAGDVRENSTLIRTFSDRSTVLERSRGGGME